MKHLDLSDSYSDFANYEFNGNFSKKKNPKHVHGKKGQLSWLNQTNSWRTQIPEFQLIQDHIYGLQLKWSKIFIYRLQTPEISPHSTLPFLLVI